MKAYRYDFQLYNTSLIFKKQINSKHILHDKQLHLYISGEHSGFYNTVAPFYPMLFPKKLSSSQIKKLEKYLIGQLSIKDIGNIV